MNDVSVLNVLLYDEIIGTLTLLPGELTLFTFAPSYINNPQRATLSLSFKDSTGQLITDLRPTRVQIPSFFSNLLPEGHMRDYLANLAGVKSKREFFLLWILGRDLPGAITIEPADGESWPPISSGVENRSAHKNALRFSLAGVQLKFSALLEASGGLTIPTEGVGGSWIVKLPSAHFVDVPENEYSMMTLARSIGMDIPDTKLISLDKISGLPKNIEDLKGEALAIHRFDRSEQGAIHIEDFSQVFGLYPRDKYSYGSYKNIAEVLSTETREEDIAEFIRRLVFNSLIGNADMHLKNLSLIYKDRRNATLAPGYDFVSTIPYLSDENMALKYVRTKRMAELSLKELSYLAAKAKIPEHLTLNTAKETVLKFKDIWQKEQKHLPLAKNVVSAIEKNISSIKLVKET